MRESIGREIELLARVSHPNIVRMLGATEDMACIVLELAKTDLCCLVKRLKLRTPIATFRDWSRQILEAVAHRNHVSGHTELENNPT
jgi:serine/threonine protein kinase